MRLRTRGGGSPVAPILLVIAALMCASAQLEGQGLPDGRTPVVDAESYMPGTWTLTSAVLGTATLFMMDDDLRDLFRDPALQGSGTADFMAGAVTHLGGWAPLAASGGVFMIGTLAGSEAVADPAIHVFGGVASATALTMVIKGVFGRARPTDSEYPVHEFGLGRGFQDGHPYRSFPSGHTTTAFAMAAALSAESSHRWPRAYPYVRWGAYSLATLTGLSRMYHNKHWASDVFLGAGIGLVVGRAFVHWRHSGAGGGVSVSPGPESGSVSVNVRLPVG